MRCGPRRGCPPSPALQGQRPALPGAREHGVCVQALAPLAPWAWACSCRLGGPHVPAPRRPRAAPSLGWRRLCLCHHCAALDPCSQGNRMAGGTCRGLLPEGARLRRCLRRRWGSAACSWALQLCICSLHQCCLLKRSACLRCSWLDFPVRAGKIAVGEGLSRTLCEGRPLSVSVALGGRGRLRWTDGAETCMLPTLGHVNLCSAVLFAPVVVGFTVGSVYGYSANVIELLVRVPGPVCAAAVGGSRRLGEAVAPCDRGVSAATRRGGRGGAGAGPAAVAHGALAGGQAGAAAAGEAVRCSGAAAARHDLLRAWGVGLE
jgi:hypothetical protein